MAHPLYWPQKSSFYPIGNTTPRVLTQYLAPGEDGKLLLLGCGDTRNILYTIHSIRNGMSAYNIVITRDYFEDLNRFDFSRFYLC